MTTAPPAHDDLAPLDDFLLPLPDAGDGLRARRRVAERRRRRIRWANRAGGSLALAVVVAFAGFALRGSPAHTRQPNAAVANRGARTHAVPVPALVLAQPAPDGSAATLMLVSLNAGGGGHVLLVPPGTMVEVPSFGLEPIGHTLTLGGPSLLGATVENLLGVTIDGVAMIDDSTWTSLVQPVGDVTVDLPERVEQQGADGQVTVLWEQGRNLVSPADVSRLLGAPAVTNDLARLARQQAFLDVWLAQLRRNPLAVPRDKGDVSRFVRGLLGNRVVVDILPVEAVESGGGGELYSVEQAEVEALVRRTMPGTADLGSSGRTRVQVLNGTGAVGLAQRVTVRLVQPPLRARVLFTDNADNFAHQTSEVVFYDRRQQAAAERVRAALGVGRLVFSRIPNDVVDVTVVVGRDFR